MNIETLDIKSIREKTLNGAKVMLQTEKETEQKIRKEIREIAKNVFITEWKDILSQIEYKTTRGKHEYNHPILISEFDKGIWNNKIMLDPDRPYIEHSYNCVEVTESNLYKPENFCGWIPSKTSEVRRFDLRRKDLAIHWLAIRMISKKLLESHCRVLYMEKRVNITSEYQRKIRYKSNCHNLHFLYISWKE